MKIAVVTPYWREAPEVLARCRATVRTQTVAATHYLVAAMWAQLPKASSAERNAATYCEIVKSRKAAMIHLDLLPRRKDRQAVEDSVAGG